MFIPEKIRYVVQQLGCSIYNALILIKQDNVFTF